LKISDFSAPALGVVGIVEVPGIGDHELKVLVVVNGGTNIRVVFYEFLQVYLPIFVLWVLQRVVQLKRVQELRKYLVFSFLAGFDLGMGFTVIAGLDVIDFNDAVLILVKLIKRLLHHSLPEWTHLPCHTSHQLVIVHIAVTVYVK